ncbi:hypothetical protein [Streptosporangium jomthongense]|uniref:AAA family ATPase n=1 Tax=Streptosporangium jomthongense TaxID=1193683 RepID=A0ABV8F3K9_9ACTN
MTDNITPTNTHNNHAPAGAVHETAGTPRYGKSTVVRWLLATALTSDRAHDERNGGTA